MMHGTMNVNIIIIKESKVHPRVDHEGPEGGQRNTALLFL
jgi:hypothetical protein